MSSDTEQPPATIKILIVGAGPCGLATAIAVTLAGHTATVFEACDGPQPFGSGVLSSPNGTRLLSRWGMDEILRPARIVPQVLQLKNLKGEAIDHRELFDDEVLPAYGFPLCTYHRADLQAGLLRKARDLGVKVHFSSRAIDIDVRDRAIELENGNSYQGDLVVVADGTWSALRSKVLGQISQPRLTGDVAYRVTIDLAKTEKDEVVELTDTAQLRIWAGPNAHITGYHVRACNQFTLMVVMSDDPGTESSSMQAIVEELRDRLHGSDKTLSVMLGAVKRVNKWRLVEVSGLPAVSYQFRSGCVLAGDSYHTLRPTLSQGFNLGLEDAATLGSLLHHVKTTEQIGKAISLYERLRSDRVQEVLDATERYENIALYSHEDSDAQNHDGRDGKPPYPNGEYLVAQEGIWCYDAYAAAEAAYSYSSDPYE
ncbi:hypothetical protein BJ166DRAFT_390536 [Pestalotiopsis sp. NC0098]|nr:hypothetical protein BJ166DRAFT_390536 [Pestalotiopsis sp. NC0098]